MTVSQVYRDLKAGRADRDAGRASGTFVDRQRRSTSGQRVREATDLHRRIDAPDRRGRRRCGIRPSRTRLAGQRAHLLPRQDRRAATQVVDGRHVPGGDRPLCAASSQPTSAPAATVEPLTLDGDRSAMRTCGRATASADLAVTFVNRQREVMALVPDTTSSSISFIPSEETRLALASLDPLARVAVVSRLPDFLPIMKIRRAALRAACRKASPAAMLETPDLDAARRRPMSSSSPPAPRTSLTGCGPARRRSNTGTSPIPAEIERVMVPLIREPIDDADAVGKESVVKIGEMNWQQVEAYLQQRRPRGPAARQHRAACAAVAVGRLDPVRAGRARSGRAARRAGLPGRSPMGSRPISSPIPARSACASRPMCSIVRDILDGLQRAAASAAS